MLGLVTTERRGHDAGSPAATRRAERRALLEKVESLLDADEAAESADEARKVAEIDAALKLGRMGDLLAREPNGEKLLAALEDDGDEETAAANENADGNAAEPAADVFALQVYVETLQMDLDHATGHEDRMAVAFRLLDFPTVLVERAGASLQAFDSGKSCLFELPFEEAVAGLQSAPMYLMLLRLPDAMPEVSASALQQGVLVGSTSLDLSGLVGLDNVGPEGCILPSVSSTWGWKRGCFPVFDLMGNRVARITARVRVCNFGDGLLPHLSLAPSQAVPARLDDGQELPDQGAEALVSNHQNPSAPAAPVPTALLESISAMEKRLGNIERLQRRALRRKRQRAGAKHVESARHPGENARPAGWLPRPDQDEASCLPPAMYFCNAAQTRDAIQDTAADSDSDFGSLDGSLDDDEIEVFGDQDDGVQQDLLRALAAHLRDLPPPRSSSSRRQGRQRGRRQPPKGRSRSRDSSGSRSETETLQGRKGARESDRRGPEVGRRQEQLDLDSGKPPVPNRRRVLRVRKTRTQVLREQATRRRYQTSHLADGDQEVGFVQLTADLARSRALSERNPEERHYLLERRRAQAARQSHESSHLRLESLVNSTLVLDSGADLAERASRARQEQLELMLRGEISPRPAFRLDGSFLSAGNPSAAPAPPPPPPPPPPLPPPSPPRQNATSNGARRDPTNTGTAPAPARDFQSFRGRLQLSIDEDDEEGGANDAGGAEAVDGENLQRLPPPLLPLTPILSSAAVAEREANELAASISASGAGPRGSGGSQQVGAPRQEEESRDSSEFGDVGSSLHSRVSARRRDTRDHQGRTRGGTRRAKPRTPSLVSIDHFVMDPVPPPDQDLASSRYQSFDGGNASLASTVF